MIQLSAKTAFSNTKYLFLPSNVFLETKEWKWKHQNQPNKISKYLQKLLEEKYISID